MPSARARRRGLPWLPCRRPRVNGAEPVPVEEVRVGVALPTRGTRWRASAGRLRLTIAQHMATAVGCERSRVRYAKKRPSSLQTALTLHLVLCARSPLTSTHRSDTGLLATRSVRYRPWLVEGGRVSDTCSGAAVAGVAWVGSHVRIEFAAMGPRYRALTSEGSAWATDVAGGLGGDGVADNVDADCGGGKHSGGGGLNWEARRAGFDPCRRR